MDAPPTTLVMINPGTILKGWMEAANDTIPASKSKPTAKADREVDNSRFSLRHLKRESKVASSIRNTTRMDMERNLVVAGEIGSAWKRTLVSLKSQSQKIRTSYLIRWLEKELTNTVSNTAVTCYILIK